MFESLRFHYDLYERHRVVGRMLRERSCRTVLDVGGNVGMLRRFLKARIVTLNVAGSADVKYDGERIPFVADAFHAVVTIDTIEHLPKPQRIPFLRECLRVAEKNLVVVAPFASPGHGERELRLHRFHCSVKGYPHPYLAQHVEYGIPDTTEISRYVQELRLGKYQLFFAGRYDWQSRIFETTDIRGRGSRRLLAALYNRAFFHPIHLSSTVYPMANRFYLVVEKPDFS